MFGSRFKIFPNVSLNQIFNELGQLDLTGPVEQKKKRISGI